MKPVWIQIIFVFSLLTLILNKTEVALCLEISQHVKTDSDVRAFSYPSLKTPTYHFDQRTIPLADTDNRHLQLKWCIFSLLLEEVKNYPIYHTNPLRTCLLVLEAHGTHSSNAVIHRNLRQFSLKGWIILLSTTASCFSKLQLSCNCSLSRIILMPNAGSRKVLILKALIQNI